MISKKESKIIIIGLSIIMVVVIMGLIYAAFTRQLNITGTSITRSSTWDIHFQNLSNITTYQTAKVLDNPKFNGNTTIEDYSVTLTTPGDSISFTFDVINDGNYDATVKSVSLSTPKCSGTDTTSNSNVCSHIHYYLTYNTGSSVQTGDTILSKETQHMKVKLEYDNTVTASELPSEDVSISNLDITINYEQLNPAYVKDNGEVEDSYTFYIAGDKITVNDEDYYVIEKSSSGQDYVVALKDKPLTVEEVNLYGIDENGVNHINRNGISSRDNGMGYGLVAYDWNENCNSYSNSSGCLKYDNAQIKYIVDAWQANVFNNGELKEVDGYKARLIKIKETNDNLGCNQNNCKNSPYEWITPYKFYWVYMPSNGTMANIIHNGSHHGYHYRFDDSFTIRPVINVYKSAIES